MATHSRDDLLDRGRNAYARRAWADTYRLLSDAERVAALAADDLALLADAAWWLGRVDESLAWFRAVYRLHIDAEANRPASLIAIIIGSTLMLRNEHAQGSAWLSRAERLLEQEPDCPERGFLDYVDIEAAMEEGRHADVLVMAQALQACGHRFGDPNLVALGVMAEGLAEVRLGNVGRGMELLDEAMLSASTDELDPGWAGNIYCNLIVACLDLGDLRRAAEWTYSTMAWCESLAAPGPFLGICRVRRAEVFTFQGQWDRAERDALAVSTTAAPFDLGSVAEAHYLMGEIARLRGNLREARDAFTLSRAHGRDPQPGYALCLLAEGRCTEAAKSIATAIAGTPQGGMSRIRLLAAQVEIALAGNDLTAAREACQAVEELARQVPGDANVATAHSCAGAVAVAEGRFREAITLLRDAGRGWRAVSAPREVARVGLLIAQASALLGDDETARQESGAAHAALANLRVATAASQHIARSASRHLPAGITEREAQVLTLLARGLTNREIGASLFISPRTVARHLENIFAKLSVSTRSAAAAWAAAHDLQPAPDGVNDPHPRFPEWVD